MTIIHMTNQWGGGEKSMKPFPPGDDVLKPTNIHSSVKQ